MTPASSGRKVGHQKPASDAKLTTASGAGRDPSTHLNIARAPNPKPRPPSLKKDCPTKRPAIGCQDITPIADALEPRAASHFEGI
jgi:hypothetical protein